MIRLLKPLVILVLLLGAGQALATKLEIAPEASIWAHVGAAILLYLHIGGGAVGLISGTVAVIARKGQKIHRWAGKVFFAAMFISYFVGGAVAPFLDIGQRPNFVASIFALYLLITGIMAARRRPFNAGFPEKISLVVSASICGISVLFIIMGATSETGTVDGSPPQGFFLFAITGGLAAIGDLKTILQGKLSNTTRVMRHLWRVCLSFFIASVSLFLGQTQLFPEWFVKSPLPFVFAFAPLIIAIGWLIKIKLSRKTQTNLTQVVRPVTSLAK